MSEFTGKLPRTSICFRCLEKKSNLQRRSQTGEDKRLVNSPRSKSAESVQIPKTDTSPVKTMTVLQSARPGTNNIEINSQSVERESQEVVNPEGFVRSSCCTDVNV